MNCYRYLTYLAFFVLILVQVDDIQNQGQESTVSEKFETESSPSSSKFVEYILI